MGEPPRVSKKKVAIFIFLYNRTRIPAFWPFSSKIHLKKFLTELPL